jgi:heme exporter protein CcmD
MPDLGQYATEVTAAYLVSIALILWIIGVSWWRSARTKRLLEEVEKHG